MAESTSYITDMRPQDILKPVAAGLCCEPGGFHIDPVRPVKRALITHGHYDHARPGHGAVLATQETLDIMRLRYGDNFAGSTQAISYGEDIKLGLSRITNMLAAVPNYDYAELGKDDPAAAPKLGERPAENVLIVTAAVPRDNEKVKSQMNSNMEWIKKVIAANGLEAAGPVRIVTNEFGSETYSFDVVQPVRKTGSTEPATAPLENLKLDGPNNPVKSELVPASKTVVATFKGHMANLSKVRDAVRAWAITHGYETSERPYENWTGGIDAGFGEEGQYEVVWAIK